MYFWNFWYNVCVEYHYISWFLYLKKKNIISDHFQRSRVFIGRSPMYPSAIPKGIMRKCFIQISQFLLVKIMQTLHVVVCICHFALWPMYNKVKICYSFLLDFLSIFQLIAFFYRVISNSFNEHFKAILQLMSSYYFMFLVLSTNILTSEEWLWTFYVSTKTCDQTSKFLFVFMSLTYDSDLVSPIAINNFGFKIKEIMSSYKVQQI